jgi:GNAT superfamily N-acetyltransferase
MQEEDLSRGLSLSRAAGWNQTLADWRYLLSLGPGLFRVGVADGRVVATGGAVRYGEALAWICMILVDPVVRGRGLGARIFDEVKGRCEGEMRARRLRAVGLDATPGGRRIYVQRGFTDGPGLVRMRVESKAPAQPSGAVRAVAARDLEAILAFDREVFGADRGAVLRWARAGAPELAWCVYAGSRLRGYCFGRRGDHSEHVGPVVAEDGAAALDLVRACLATARDRPLVVDARVEPSWLAALGEMGFREQRPFTRMYLGEARPPARPALEPAVLGPEFG